MQSFFQLSSENFLLCIYSERQIMIDGLFLKQTTIIEPGLHSFVSGVFISSGIILLVSYLIKIGIVPLH